MKKKLFLAIIAVLVVCLMCGVLFVACNDDPPSPGTDDPIGPGTDDPIGPGTDDPGDEEDELTKSGVFIDLVKNFDAVEQDATGEKEFTFGLQIKDRADQTSIFSIALENVGGKDYLYGAVGTTVFTKFNGFDLGETFMTILNWLGPIDLTEVVGIQAGLDVRSLTNPLVAGIASDMLIGDFAMSESGDAYMVELNIAKLISSLAGFGLDLDAVINGALGEDTVTTVVNALAGVIGIELAEGSATVTGLLSAIANAYQVNFYFGFDTATADDEDPFDGLLPGVQAARDTDAKNLLNFEGEVIVEGLDANNGIENTYVLDIDVDVNPFVALGLLDYVSTTGGVMTGNLEFSFGGFGPSDIVAMLEDAGYIHISLDKYAGTNTDADPVRNLFTLHYDSAEGKAVVSVATNKVTVGGEDLVLAAGGVYDIDALAQVINSLIEKAKPVVCEHVDVDPADCVCDTCGAALAHVNENDDNLCDVCGTELSHVDADENGVCDTCGACLTHADANEDGRCDHCGVEVAHIDADDDNRCDICEACMGHIDADKDSFCDTCGACLAHKDANGDVLCDNCGEIMDVMDYIMSKAESLVACFYDDATKTFKFDADALGALATEVLTDTDYLSGLTKEEINNLVADFVAFAKTLGYDDATGIEIGGAELSALVSELLTILRDKLNWDEERFTNEVIADFAALAAKIEGLVNFTTTSGLTINVTNALDIAQGLLDFFFDDKVDAIEAARGYVEDLLGGHAQLRFKVAEGAFSFGHFEENEKIAFENLTYNLGGSDAYVETITAISKEGEGEIAVGDTVNVTGKGFDGTEITAEGVVMAIDDGTYYVGIYTDLNTNLGVLESIINSFAEPDITINIQPSWPFYGVLAYTPAA